MDTTDVTEFFARYAEALLARDADRIATMYAVPGLILFPGSAIAVGDPAQTAAFFRSAFGQYEGIDEARTDVAVMGTAPGSVWADVTWRYDDVPRERFCYQLVEAQDGTWRIAVLTPMPVPGQDG